MLLQKGGPRAILRALTKLLRAGTAPDAEAVRKEFRYLFANRHRMPYADHIERGLPIGSGAMESAIKQACVSRLRQPGMKWTKDGSDAILRLRCAKLSGTLADTNTRKHESLQGKLKVYLPAEQKVAA